MRLDPRTSQSRGVVTVAFLPDFFSRLFFSARWVQCTDKVNYSMADVSTSVLPVYQDVLLQQNLRILVYSGDVDAVVPHIGGCTLKF